MSRKDLNLNLLFGLYCAARDADFGLTTPMRYELPGDYVHLVSPSVTGALLKRGLLVRQPSGRLVLTDAGNIALAANAGNIEREFALLAGR
jgi:hypothetical protein